MVGADFGTQRTGRGAFAGSARWRFAWNVARGVAARDSAFAFRWAAVWGSRCGGGFGARNLVGAASGMVQQNSGRDGSAARLVSLDRHASELCRGELSRSSNNQTSLELDRRPT